MDKKEKIKRSFIIVVIMVIAVVSIISARERRNKMKEEKQVIEKKDNYSLTGNYNVDLIKKFHEVSDNKNYLISPYNIEIGLNMLRDGASGKTKEELDQVLGNRKINDVSLKNVIGIANGVFIKDEYKDNVKKDYYNILKTKYNSDIIYDRFTKPDKINNWVNEKTSGMIDKILDKMNEDFVMGLASALAIDVKWFDSFDCNLTKSSEFTKLDKEKINVEMMHQSYDSNAQYIKTNNATGIIIPYEWEDNSDVHLEFVALLPNENIDTFIKNLNKEELDSINSNQRSASSNLHLNLSLPRFKYDFNANGFIDILKNLGIKDAFDKDNANFKKMIEIKENVYVGEAIHKTHIELNEVGTKAAAITYFGMFKATGAMPVDFEEINLEFNRPFIYMIRETNTKELLFFGTVYEPNIWNGPTCDNK